MYDRRKSSHKISSELYIMRTLYIVIRHWQWYAKLFFGVSMYMMASGPTAVRKENNVISFALYYGGDF